MKITRVVIETSQIRFNYCCETHRYTIQWI